jgi:hypothetical protein
MRAASIPALSATRSASAITACVQPTMSWLIIFAASPAPGGPMCVHRLDTSFMKGTTRATSASSPPIITVSVPVADAGGPPETGASIHPHPVASRSRAANARPFSTFTVEKSTTSCGGSSAPAAPSAPNIASSTASVVGRLSRTKSTPRAASAADFAATAPAACAASTCGVTMSYTRTAYPSDTRRFTMGSPMRPTPT